MPRQYYYMDDQTDFSAPRPRARSSSRGPGQGRGRSQPRSNSQFNSRSNSRSNSQPPPMHARANAQAHPAMYAQWDPYSRQDLGAPWRANPKQLGQLVTVVDINGKKTKQKLWVTEAHDGVLETHEFRKGAKRPHDAGVKRTGIFYNNHDHRYYKIDKTSPQFAREVESSAWSDNGGRNLHIPQGHYKTKRSRGAPHGDREYLHKWQEVVNFCNTPGYEPPQKEDYIDIFVKELISFIKTPQITKWLGEDYVKKFNMITMADEGKTALRTGGKAWTNLIGKWKGIIKTMYHDTDPNNPNTIHKHELQTRRDDNLKSILAQNPTYTQPTWSDEQLKGSQRLFLVIQNMLSNDGKIKINRAEQLRYVVNGWIRLHPEVKSDDVSTFIDKLKGKLDTPAQKNPKFTWPKGWERVVQSIWRNVNRPPRKGKASSEPAPPGSAVVDQASQAFLPNLRPMSFV